MLGSQNSVNQSPFASLSVYDLWGGLGELQPQQVDTDMAATKNPFEIIKRADPEGVEFWASRELSEALSYDDYRNFENVIDKAITSCIESDHDPDDHFVEVTEMIETGKGAKRAVETYWLSRYACYLTIQNADPSKPMVALGQTYFAIQTRRQELADDRSRQMEDQSRLQLRDKMKGHNKDLASAAKSAGISEPKQYAIFQNEGYKGLYGGMTMKEIHAKKELKKSQHILDHMGSTELAANLFRATQTEEALRRKKVASPAEANRTHNEVGKKVRQTMRELGNPLPEELPTAESIKKVEARERKRIDSDESD